ncbi:vascular endothelial growth factor A-like isoform X3 [Oreochromis aureus]|uniref:vascular endothelial growth factor A-like isoform X3 n=1 Tax=Oreochromis aureus TaxID=47969 RepID=UPI001952C814|nr:vascular endothelial growth factor A-like isoform X3 [Oreochromis aureus]
MFSPAGARSSTQPGSRSGTARYKSSSRFSTLPSTFSFLSGRLEDSRNSFPAAAACKLSSQSCSFCWFFSGYLRRCPTFKMKGVPIQVMAKCSCQVMDQLVYVYDEYPQSVENMYVPHCVVVRRCSGYCSDEGFKCLPTLERNTTLQLMIRSSKPTVVELTFLEHRQCECRKPDNLQYYERSVIKSQQQQQVH